MGWLFLFLFLAIISIISNIITSLIRIIVFKKKKSEMSEEEFHRFTKISMSVSQAVFIIVTVLVLIWLYTDWL